MRRPFSAHGLLLTRPPREPRRTGGSYADIVRRGEVGSLYCGHCVPPYEIKAILFHEPPWNRYLNYPSSWSFRCPGCGRALIMHLDGGPGTPFTERFGEKSV